MNLSMENKSPYFFDPKKNTFGSQENLETLTKSLKIPMSITLQVTRKCNLQCIYCSEDAQMSEPSLEMIKKMIDNIRGIERVIVAGGEPTLRKDLPEILDYLKSSGIPIVAIASNAVLINKELAKNLARSLDYADITIDGTPEIHNKIRGQYNKVIEGIQNLKDAGVTISLVNVLLTDNISDILDVCRMADKLGAKKLKILTPINKGRGSSILSHKINSEGLADTFDLIKKQKEKEKWSVRITITDWNTVSEGHAILIHPDGDVVASPVPSNQNCIDIFGNVLTDKIQECWKEYHYVDNHVKKYLEDSLMVC